MVSKCTILVVDDNAATRYAIRRVLERHGYVVLEAGTGTEGLTAVMQEKLDALILDVNLPDMRGFDIVRLLRGDHQNNPRQVLQGPAGSMLHGDVVSGLEPG